MPAKKSTVTLSNEQLALGGIDFSIKKAAIKELEAQCKEVRGPLESAVMGGGVETSTGSKVLSIDHADKTVILKETLRVSQQLLPDAIDILRKEGLDECIETIEVVREDVIERLYDAGRISDDVLSKIYQSKSSYAFSVEVKNRYEV